MEPTMPFGRTHSAAPGQLHGDALAGTHGQYGSVDGDDPLDQLLRIERREINDPAFDHFTVAPERPEEEADW